MLYNLREGSWEDDAVVRDTARGVCTDPDKVHHIGHEVTHFTVPVCVSWSLPHNGRR
ncbi:hypothetical protein HNP40_000828 [Mycobacteroides chelonae]|nr:hypothetical protein [Mycobacteroides chelonae]